MDVRNFYSKSGLDNCTSVYWYNYTLKSYFKPQQSKKRYCKQ